MAQGNMQFHTIRKKLEALGVAFAPGLSDKELRQIQQEYHLCFPPDLKDFLMAALPISQGFPNWREGPKQEILRKLEWPYEGLCFDIKNNSF